MFIKSGLPLHPEKEAQPAAAENKLRECLALRGTLGSLEVPITPLLSPPLSLRSDHLCCTEPHNSHRNPHAQPTIQHHLACITSP